MHKPDYEDLESDIIDENVEIAIQAFQTPESFAEALSEAWDTHVPVPGVDREDIDAFDHGIIIDVTGEGELRMWGTIMAQRYRNLTDEEKRVRDKKRQKEEAEKEKTREKALERRFRAAFQHLGDLVEEDPKRASEELAKLQRHVAKLQLSLSE